MSTARSPHRVYCVCKQPWKEGEEMVFCDSCEDWFHLPCVGLSDISDVEQAEQYMCPACSVSSQASSILLDLSSADQQASSGSTRAESADGVHTMDASQDLASVEMLTTSSDSSDTEHHQRTHLDVSSSSNGQGGSSGASLDRSLPLPSSHRGHMSTSFHQQASLPNGHTELSHSLQGSLSLGREVMSPSVDAAYRFQSLSVNDSAAHRSSPINIGRRRSNSTSGSLVRPRRKRTGSHSQPMKKGGSFQPATLTKPNSKPLSQSVPSLLESGEIKVEECPNRHNAYHKCTSFCHWRWTLGQTNYKPDPVPQSSQKTRKGKSPVYGPNRLEDQDVKRLFHNERERMRRSTIRKLFEELRRNVPAVEDQDGTSDRQILVEAARHISDLDSEGKELERQLIQLKMENVRLRLHTMETSETDPQQQLSELFLGAAEIAQKQQEFQRQQQLAHSDPGVDMDTSSEASKHFVGSPIQDSISMGASQPSVRTGFNVAPNDSAQGLVSLIQVAEQELESIPETA